MLNRVLLILLFSQVLIAEAELGSAEIKVGNFSAKNTSEIQQEWEALSFRGIEKPTSYSLSIDERGIQTVHARTQGGASGWIRKLDIDPEQYPIIRWSWKVSSILPKGDMYTKAGDDYPARLYLLFEYEPNRVGWAERLARKAISLIYGETPPGSSVNYIWANKYPEGTYSPNAFTDSARMWAVEGGAVNVGKWRYYSRNILDDYIKLFGYKPPRLIGIAIMSDADNTGGTVEAWFGDIILSSGLM